ncbi:hypothetical protein [Candidatus Nitrosocosmicus sp. R]
MIKKRRLHEVKDNTKDNIGLASQSHKKHYNDTKTEKSTKIMNNTSNMKNYSNNLSGNSDHHYRSFIWADKLDLQIIKQLLVDPYIQTFEISSKLEIPLALIHRKRRLIETTILKKKFIIDLRKLGLDYRYADVFAHIQKKNIKNFVNEIFKTSVSKNILQVLTTTDGSDGICIKTMFQDSKELFCLMDEIKSKPSITDVHFSEEIEKSRDNTLPVLLNILKENR